MAGPNDCAELRLRVRDGIPLTYPEWASVDVDAGQFTVHELDDNSWAGCLAAVSRLADDHLDPRVYVRGGCTSSPLCTAYPAPREPGRSPSCRSRMCSPTGRDRRRWRRGCSAATVDIEPLTTPRLRGINLPWRSFSPHGRTASWSATLNRAWYPRRRSRVRRCGPTPDRRARAACAPWSDTATDCPAQRVTIGVLCAVSTALSAHLRELGR